MRSMTEGVLSSDTVQNRTLFFNPQELLLHSFAKWCILSFVVICTRFYARKVPACAFRGALQADIHPTGAAFAGPGTFTISVRFVRQILFSCPRIGFAARLHKTTE